MREKEIYLPLDPEIKDCMAQAGRARIVFLKAYSTAPGQRNLSAVAPSKSPETSVPTAVGNADFEPKSATAPARGQANDPRRSDSMGTAADEKNWAAIQSVAKEVTDECLRLSRRIDERYEVLKTEEEYKRDKINEEARAGTPETYCRERGIAAGRYAIRMAKEGRPVTANDANFAIIIKQAELSQEERLLPEANNPTVEQVTYCFSLPSDPETLDFNTCRYL